MGRKILDLTGKRIGGVEVLALHGRGPAGKSIWLCRCDCGESFTAAGTKIKTGRQRSCGCAVVAAHTKHSAARRGKRSRAYRSWLKMRRRCAAKPHERHYRFYVARGIRVCDRWQNSFADFLEDMGECPDGCTLDRIDGALGYYKENCRWATKEQQLDNRRKPIPYSEWVFPSRVSA